MKAIQRSVYGESQKQFAKLFDSLTGAHNRWEIWSDFVTMAAIAVSNKVDRSNAAEREKTYLTLASKYKEKELPRFSEMLAELVQGMEADPDQDYLGELYMSLSLGNQQAGQFFTPYDVCRAMAGLTWGDYEEQIKQRGWISVNDCACGAGATLVAFANECRRHGVNYQTQVLFTAQDVDSVVGMMCYLQLSLMGCAGYVVIDDTLAKPSTSYDKHGLIPVHGSNVWYTPMYFRAEWHFRRIWARMDLMFQAAPREPEILPAVEETETPDEQMTLF
jgi:type I restriction-modification system DNA methylase subunit